RAFSSRETVGPAKIQGAPRAPRPIMTAAQPVARIMAHASSWLITSPLPVTGIPTASTTEAMISRGARPENCCERVRGWTVIASTPSLSASRAISTAFTVRSSQPPRILIVRGTRIAFRRVRRISRAASGSRMSEGLLVDTPTLHDHLQVIRVLEGAQVPDRVARDDDEVGVLAGLDGADPVGHPEELGIDLRRREQDLHRLHHLRLQLELGRALDHHIAQQVGARANPAAGAVGVREPLHRLPARQVDLLDLLVADPVALALAVDRLVGDHGGHEKGAGVLDRLRRGLADQVAVLDRAHARRDRVAHGGVRVRVGEDVFADCLSLLHGGAHLGDRELRRVELVGGRHGAAGRHELDLIHVAADLLARRLPHLRLAVGDRADHADAAVDRRDPFGPPAFVVVTGPGSGPTLPLGRTSLMRSSSTTTAAPSTGSAPVQSMSNVLVRIVRLIAPPPWPRTSTPSRRRAATTRRGSRPRRGRAAARGTPTAPRRGRAAAARRRRRRGPWGRGGWRRGRSSR